MDLMNSASKPPKMGDIAIARTTAKLVLMRVLRTIKVLEWFLENIKKSVVRQTTYMVNKKEILARALELGETSF